MHRFLSSLFLGGLLASLSFSVAAQQSASPKTLPTGAAQGLSDWRHVQALPPKTNVHITTDHGGKTCHVFAVNDDSLTCAKGNAAGDVIQRAQIQHIKLTHYGRSTLVGLGIGGGIGAIAGAIGGRTPPCQPQTFCLNGIGLGAEGVAAVFGVAGGVLGAVIGGPLDISRGSAIYVRP